MSNLTNFQRKLSEGVTGWLTFEFYCFRGKIFSEKYLAYPIGQILNSINEFKTSAEVNHPKSGSKQGRPLQIDFVLKDDDKKGDDDIDEKWHYAIESKWIGNTSISLGSMIWDLIRLQNLHEHHSELKTYFVLSGFQKKIKILLDQCPIVYNGKKEEKGFVKITAHNIILNLLSLDSKTKDYINNRITKYPEFKLYSKIVCKPAHVFPRKDIINMTFSTYVMEVMSPNKTTRLDVI